MPQLYIIFICSDSSTVQLFFPGANTARVPFPQQEEPSASPVVDDEVELLNIGKTTNLTSLLSEIRKLSLDGEYKLAEKMASHRFGQNRSNRRK